LGMISLQRRCKKRHLNQVFSIRGGLLLKKLTQKSYFTGLRGRYLCSFEFYRTAIFENNICKEHFQGCRQIKYG
ncbi:hypothetical protein, partial [Prevotella corporis]|uniref:hypothetical protein n=1 Tax=Prevotella corporis TaxID=28128 RepID=UPI0031DE34D0